MTSVLRAPLAWLGRRGLLILALSILLGLAVPELASIAKPAVAPAIFLLLTQSLIRLDLHALRGHVGRFGLLTVLVGFSIVLCPLVLWHLSLLAGLPVLLAVGVLLMGAAPPMVSAPAIALMLGLDAELILLPMVVATALVPLTLPALLALLAGLELQLNLVSLSLRLLLFVGAAFIVATLLRLLVPPARIRAEAQVLDGLGVICLTLFALGIMDGAADVLKAQPSYFALATATAFVGYLLLQALGALAFAWLGRRPSLSIGLLVSNRNMGLVAAVLADKLPPDTLVFFAIGQLPIYILPALLAPAYRAMLRSSTPD
ncbi:MAG: hypothetical protein FJX35_23575 [Alphaproteobacteria bacterium]|nr:hypothetical protein [Alphaproteobacteria bacterium]MBM4073722.1 hypothetical protein [Planctomycetota bacterium]